MIVEGYGKRRYIPDFVKHLVYAIAECDETMVHLSFLFETGSWKDEEKYKQLIHAYDLLSKRINKFTQWVEHNLRTEQQKH